MSKAYADEQIRKKKEEEEQKQNQSQDQQKSQPKANEPVGTTSIPKDTKKEESKGTTPKTEHSTIMTQAKQDAQNRTVQRNVTGRTMETDTATRRQDFRTYEQKVHDLHMDTLFPGTTGHNYSNSMKASNKYYTPQREKYEARNSQNRAQTFSPADLPTAEEFRLSQMTDAERMQELMNNRDSMPIQQNRPVEAQNILGLKQNNPSEAQFNPAKDFKLQGAQDNNKMFDVERDFGIKPEREKLDLSIQSLVPVEPVKKEESSIPDEVVDQYAKLHNLSFEDAKQKFVDAERMRNQTITTPGVVTEEDKLATDLAQAQYAERRRLDAQRQYTPYEAFELHAGKALSDIPNGVVYPLGKLLGTGWDLENDRIREEAAIANEQHPIASTAGNIAGMAMGGYALGGGSAGMQPSGNLSAGESFKAIYNNALQSGASKVEAITEGLKTATQVGAINAAGSLKMDFILDILPTLSNDLAEGKGLLETALHTLGNTALNWGMNGLGELGSTIGALKDINKAGMDNGISSLADAAEQSIVNAASDVAKNADNVIPGNQVLKDAANQTNIAKNVDTLTEDERFLKNAREGAEKLRRANVVMDAEKNADLKQYGNLQEVDPVQLLDNEGQVSELLKKHPEVDTIRTAPFKEQSVLDAESKSLVEQIESFKANRNVRNYSLDIGEPSEILKQYGVGDKRLHMELNNVEKVLAAPGEMPKKVKHPHEIGTGAFEALPEKLDKPLAIIKNANGEDGNCVVILTDMATKSGDPVNIALRINKDGKVRIDNKLTSVYGRGKIEYYLEKEMDAGNVLYYDYTQTKSAFDKAHSRVQSPTGTSNALNAGAVDQTALSDFNVSKGVNNVNARDIVEDAAEKAQDTVPVKVDDTIPGSATLPNEAKPNGGVPELDKEPPKTFDRGGKEKLVDTQDVKERGYAQSTRNNPDIPDELAAEFTDKPELYNVLHNKDTKAKSDEVLAQGFDKAYSDFKDMLNRRDPTAIPVGYDLAKQMIENGDADGAAELIRDMSRELTNAGQFSQAAAMTIMRGDPMTALRYAEKEIDKMNADGLKQYGKKWKDLALTEDEIKKFASIEKGDKEAIQSLYDEIGTRLGKDYPVTAWEKIKEARRLSMLFNIRTQTRNFGANIPTATMRWASDRVDAIGQHVAKIINPDFKVTQSLKGSAGKRSLAKEIYDSDRVQAIINGTTGKYKDPDIKAGIMKEKQIFKGTKAGEWIDRMTGKGVEKVAKLLGKDIQLDGALGSLNAKAFGKKGVHSGAETLRNLTYAMLELGDSPFVKENFIDRLGSYLNAQNIKSIDEVPDEAIQIAWDAAMKATYKDESQLFKAISGLKKSVGDIPFIGKPLAESSVSFVQAPANIGQRILDYSPLGGAVGVKNIIKAAKEGNEQLLREGIKQTADGLTGSGLIYFGMKLRQSGLVTGTYSNDKDERAQQQKEGFKEFALHIGDHYYTYDWMQPFAEPLIMGTLIADAIDKGDKYESDMLKYAADKFGTPELANSKAAKVLGVTGQAVKSSVNSWFDATPMKSMEDLFSSSYNDADGIAGNFKDVLVDNFVGAFEPAQLKAVTKIMDPYKKQTKDPSNSFATTVNRLKAGLPFLSETVPTKYDTWGQPVKYGETAQDRAIATLANPGEYSYEKKKPIDTEIDRVFEKTGDNGVFPPEAPSKVGDTKLTANQVSELQKVMGERNLEAAETLMKDRNYGALSNKFKAEAYGDVYEAVGAISKLSVSDPELYKKIQNGDEEAISHLEGLAKVYAQGGAQALVDEIVYKKTLKKVGIDGSDKTREIYDNAKSRYDAEQQLYGLRNYQNWYKKEGFSGNVPDKLEEIWNSDASKEDKQAQLHDYKMFRDTTEELGLTATQANEERYNTLGEQGYREYAEVYNEAKEFSEPNEDGTKKVTNAGIIKALENRDAKDQSRLAELMISDPAKGATQAQKDYDNGFYRYYQYKTQADKDGNGRISKEESEALFGPMNLPDEEKAYFDKVLRNSKTSSFDGTGKPSKSTNTVKAQTSTGSFDMSLSGKQRLQKSQTVSQELPNGIPSDSGLPTVRGQSDWDVDTHVVSPKNGKTYDYANSAWYKRGAEAGYSPRQLLDIHSAADSNGDTSVSKQEAIAYINALNGLTQDQKRDLFPIVASRNKGNPY